MTYIRSIVSLTLLTYMLLVSPLVLADAKAEAEAEKLYEKLFEDRVNKALASDDKEDNLALAEQMVKALDGDGLTKEFKARLCEGIVLLTDDTSIKGWILQNHGLTFLIEQGPAYEAKARSLQVDMIKKEINSKQGMMQEALFFKLYAHLAALAMSQAEANDFSSADKTLREAGTVARKLSGAEQKWVKDARSDFKDRQKVMKRWVVLQRTLMSKPTERLAREGTEILVLKLDRPEEALDYAKAAGLKEWAEMLAFIQDKPAKELSDEELFKLMVWWGGLIKEAPDFASAGMHERLLGWGKVAAERPSIKGIQRIELDQHISKSKSWLAEHQAPLEKIKLATKVEKPGKGNLGRRVDLIPYFEAYRKKWTVEGWSLNDGKLEKTNNNAFNYLHAYLKPGDIYQVSFNIESPSAGNHGVAFHMPAGGSYVLTAAFTHSGRMRIGMLQNLVNARIPKSKEPLPCVVQVRIREKAVDVKMFVAGKLVTNVTKDKGTMAELADPSFRISPSYYSDHFILSEVYLESTEIKKFKPRW